MANEPTIARYIRVPTNPDNVFNDPWNVGVFTGTVTGLTASYFFGSKIYPFMRKVVSASFTGRTKLALVVNADLQMTKGKIASQCSHGSMMAYHNMRAPFQPYKRGLGLLTAWQFSDHAKVVLRAPDMKAILELEKVAKEHRIPVYRVLDAGRTQVPQGSLTVLAMGPGPHLIVAELTAHLRSL